MARQTSLTNFMIIKEFLKSAHETGSIPAEIHLKQEYQR